MEQSNLQDICVIPARGGSKRIPRKNIKPFRGKPLIAYSIEVALASECFDQVIVSTDDDEIAGIARAYGAATPFVRPPELSNDFCGTNEVVKHAIETLQKQGVEVNLACCLYATAPFVEVDDLINGKSALIEQQADFAMTVTTFAFPIQRAAMLEQSQLKMIDSAMFDMRSQDLPECYHDAGQIYWGSAQSFVLPKKLYEDITVPIILPRHRVQDIDTLEDWQRAELMHQVLYPNLSHGINE